MLLSNRNFIDNFFNDPFFFFFFGSASSQIMKTDIHENDANYLVEMELPGYKKEDIKADLKDGYLTITASRNEAKEEHDSKGKCIRKERYTGSCNRSFYVGKELTQDDIKAAFSDGILRLSIPKEVPKAIEEQPRYIAIE